MAGGAHDWDGPKKGAFDDPLNWTNSNTEAHGVPGGLDAAIVLGTATHRITITSDGKVATLDARYLTIAGSIAAGSADLSGNIVVDTGAGLNTDDADIGGNLAIGGFVSCDGAATMDSTGTATIGVSTGVADSIGWTVKGYFDDFLGDVVVEHGGSYLTINAGFHSGGMDLRSGSDKLEVTDDATLTTSGLFASYGATVVFDKFAHVYATGSNFSYGKSLFSGPFVADGLVSADFEGSTTIDDADFTGQGAIVIGYQNKEEAGALADKASVRVSGSARVTDSYTLIADGTLDVGGSATWTAGGGSAKHGMDGTIQVGWFSKIAKTAAMLSVEGAAMLNGATLAIEADGAFSLGARARALLGAGSSKMGAVVVGVGGKLELDGAAGSYRAATDIRGGTMEIERAGASGTASLDFGSAGGQLIVDKGADVGNAIAGFSDHASIDFLHLAATSATFDHDVLTLEDKSKIVATVKFASSEHLIVASDDNGGTEITYGGKSGVTFETPADNAGAFWSFAGSADFGFGGSAGPQSLSLFPSGARA